MRATIASCLLISLTTPAIASDCDSILQHGLWNSRVYEREFDHSYRARDWYCKHFRHESRNGSDSSLFLGIDEFGLDFGFSEDEEKLTVEDVCFESDRSQDLRQRVEDIWRTASGVIVRAWSECKKDEAEYNGVRAWVNTTADPTKFDLELRFNTNTNFSSATIKNAIIQGGNCVSPNGFTFNDSSEFELEKAGASALCERSCAERQVRIAFASNFRINGGKLTTIINLPPAEPPSVGLCKVTAQVPHISWQFKGNCVSGYGESPVSEDGTGRTSEIDYTVSASAPNKLGGRCGNFVCDRLGDNDGCGHLWTDLAQEIRINERTVRVKVPYSSHTVRATSYHQILEHTITSVPTDIIEATVSAEKTFRIEYPSNNLGVEVLCNIGGNAFSFDPKDDFSNEMIDFVSRNDAGENVIVNFLSKSEPLHRCQ